MGAIAGIVYPDTFQVTDRILPMMRALQRRAQGSPEMHTWRNIQIGALGHAIGYNKKHTVAAALDGQLYNASALRKKLKSLGHHPENCNEAELIVCAYECWELGFLEHIDGDFALVIIDETSSQVLIARDRIGKKPLYWYRDGNQLMFASELHALLATGLVPQTPAVDGLAAYFSLGYIPQDVTPIANVNKLLPGHYLTFGPKQQCNVGSYWSYSSYFTHARERPKVEVVKRLDELVKESITKRIEHDNPVGCFVSGGLGSAGIAYFTKDTPGAPPVIAYSAGFEKDNQADLSAATSVCKALSLPHRSEVMTPKTFLNDLVKVVWHLGEPLADPNVLSTWHLARLASSETQQVLSGMGSDELLAGHTRYTIEGLGEPYEPWFHKLIQPIQRTVIVPILKYLNPGAALDILRDSRTNPWQAQYLEANALFDKKLLSKAAPPLTGLFNLDTFLQKFYRLDNIQSLVASYLYFDMKTRLPECYILQYDRLTTAFNLSWEAPYLSREIIEYLAGITEPDALRADDTATYLKALLRPHLPGSVLDRPKEQRPHFLESWADSGPVKEAFQLLLNGTCVDIGLVSKRWLTHQLDTASSRRHAFRYLWAVLILEIWYRLFISSPITYEAPEISLVELLSE